MYNKPMLGLEQCQAAINAMIADFNRTPDRRPVDMAVVDDAGNLLAYARMDKCLRPTYAINKAYTSAMRGMDSVNLADQLKALGMSSLSEMGDPRLTLIQGGLVVRNPSDNAVLGGIGVGGLPTGKEDEDIARAGLAALGL